MNSNYQSDTAKQHPSEHMLMNGRELAKALYGGTMAAGDYRGEWHIYGIKKANKMAASRGEEPLIFTGRYSTPFKISKWLEAHPGFIAADVLQDGSRSRAKAPVGTRGGVR